MQLLVLGLSWFVTCSIATIPPWSPTCPQQSSIPNACVFGNMQVGLFKKTLYPKDCNHPVEIEEFKYPPVIQLDSTNQTDMFTMVMVDLGPEGRGPNLLQWMLTNVTVNSLRNYKTIPQKYVLYNYNLKSLPRANERSLVQILVFRHHNVLRVPFGELWVTQVRDFSLRTLLSNTNHTLRLCGPVAATQYWLFNASASAAPNYQPSAPPAPPQYGQGQPLQPQPGQPQFYIPVIPVAPAGQPQAPLQPQAPIHPPANIPHNTNQYGNTKFPKRSAAVTTQPMLSFVPLAVLAVLWL